jgi:hypothetical protein
MKNKISFGSISCFTMKTEDVMPKFVEELLYLSSKNRLANRLDRKLDKLDSEQWDIYFNSEEADFDLEDVIQELNKLCENIPYAYFGTHPGDGADYGFWVDINTMEDDVRMGELLTVDDLNKVPKKHYGLVAEVNDHGNTTLYKYSNGHRYYVWGVV